MNDYFSLLQTIYEFGRNVSPRGQEIKELLGMKLIVENEIFFDFGECRSLDKTLSYWKREFAWYMAGNRQSEYIERHAKLWAEIKSKEGFLNSNYGWLVFYNRTGQGLAPYEWALTSLLNDKESRQAVITFNTGRFNIVGTKDYICTQFMHFLIRNDELICFIGLRSSDAIFGLPNNIPFWKFVQLQLLSELKTKYPHLQPGKIVVNIDSAHIYQRHYELVKTMLKKKPKNFHMTLSETVPLDKSAEWYYDNFDKFISINSSNINSSSLNAI